MTDQQQRNGEKAVLLPGDPPAVSDGREHGEHGEQEKKRKLEVHQGEEEDEDHVIMAHKVSVDEDDEQEEERKLVSKFDWRILPFVGFLYLLSFLDRANVGNVHTALNKSLGFTEAQFSFTVGIFFLGYVVFEVPSNLILKQTRPAIWIAVIMLVWGILSTCCAAIESFSQLVVLRVFLGAAEAGFFPGVIFYLQFFYTRRELASRVAIFYSAATLAGVVGGILAYFILQMDGIAGIDGWRWLFLIEGIPSLFAAVATYYYLPDYPKIAVVTPTSWLNQDEKKLALKRLQAKGVVGLAEPKKSNDDVESHADSENTTAIVWRTLCNPSLILFSIEYISLCTALYSVSFFLPSMVENIGFTSLRANLITAPLNAVAAVVTIGMAFSSDRRQERYLHLTFSLSMTFLGFLGLALCDFFDLGNKVSYFFPLASAALVTGFGYANNPICIAWLTDRFQDSATEKAVASATMISVGNIGGFLGPSLFGWLVTFQEQVTHHDDGTITTTEQRRYARAYAVIAGILAIGVAILVALNRSMQSWRVSNSLQCSTSTGTTSASKSTADNVHSICNEHDALVDHKSSYHHHHDHYDDTNPNFDHRPVNDSDVAGLLQPKSNEA